MPDERTITDVASMSEIASNPENKGKTFEVSRPVFDHFVSRMEVEKVSTGDVERIKEMTGADITVTDKTGTARDCICPSCSHKFTLADHVQAALEIGVHNPEELKGFMVSDKYLLTVDTDETRQIKCVECGERFPAARCCYSLSWYAYV